MISVIIPVFNDPEGIERTLQSLIAQTAASDEYEIIAVDNKSADETPVVIQQFVNDYPKIVKYAAETSTQSSYAARNKGIEVASGDIFAFFDADMWVDETYVEDVRRCITECDAEYVGLNVSLKPETNIETVAGRYDYLTGFPIKRYIHKNNYAPTCCLVVRSEVVNVVGKFDGRLMSGGDRIFGKKVSEAGFTQKFCEDIMVYHPVRDSTREMLQKAIRIGRGKTQLAEYHPELAGDGSLGDPKSYLPPRPFQMKALADKRTDISIFEFCAVYLFGIIYKYTRLYGTIIEATGK